MAKQQKPKTGGNRNPERRNGKAPKKNPKLPRQLSAEEREQRDAIKAERAAKEAARKKASINKLHERALADHKVWLAEQKRQKAAEAIARMPKPRLKGAGL